MYLMDIIGGIIFWNI